MSGGGLTQVVASSSNQDVMLTHNPSKTFFKAAYARYTNFALQKFILNYEGNKEIQLTEASHITFKVKRYADLLMDCNLCITLPNIYSPIVCPSEQTNFQWVPYEFKWIPFIGAQIIQKVTVTCGSQKLQEFSGDYILSQVDRDFTIDKKELFYKMIGHVPELYDPANSGSRVNSYPSCYYTDFLAGTEPSIRSRDLYIPLHTWFSLKPAMAFPLIALQYNELVISVTLRPVREWFIVRDVYDEANNYPYISPNFSLEYFRMFYFLHNPPDIYLTSRMYTDQRTNWNSNIHILATYCFLSNEESRQFALQEHTYLIKQVKKDIFHNLCGPSKIKIDSNNMLSSLMFYFQRSDAHLRNEWHNYSNWPYNYLPNDLKPAPTTGNFIVERLRSTGEMEYNEIGPGVNRDGKLTGIMLTGDYSFDNTFEIMTMFSIMFEGTYRENDFASGVFKWVEKYTRSNGNSNDGLYCYNFCLNTTPTDSQPSGAVNMSKFNKIELQLNTIVPALDINAQTMVICDPDSGNIVGINKPTWRIYEYTFDLTVFQETYNMLTFNSGNCGMAFAT
jgi:hypothetical protein